MNPTTLVLVSVMPVKSPIHGVSRGQKIAACIPNTAGLKGAPAFRKPYLVGEAAFFGEQDRERFEKELARQGFYHR